MTGQMTLSVHFALEGRLLTFPGPAVQVADGHKQQSMGMSLLQLKLLGWRAYLGCQLPQPGLWCHVFCIL